MSLISSQELAVSPLVSNEPECEPSRSVRSSPSKGPSSKNIGQKSPAMTMLAPSHLTASEQTAFPWMSFVEDSRARISATRETVRALKANAAGYGKNTPDLLANFDLATSWWKTSQHCLIEGLTLFSGTWPRSGTMRSGTAYRLQLSALHSLETGLGLLPTPRASMWNKCWVRVPDRGNLEEVLGTLGLVGWISPLFVEKLMGFPETWTELALSATPLSRKSRKSSGER